MGRRLSVKHRNTARDKARTYAAGPKGGPVIAHKVARTRSRKALLKKAHPTR